tara:strand:- start:301 stop:552 length:252 start_codon:yes stop_codon:yes gene_type:complete
MGSQGNQETILPWWFCPLSTRLKRLCLGSLFGHNQPNGMQDTRQNAKHGQDNIDEEMLGGTHLKKSTNRRKEYCQNQIQYAHF